MHPGLTLLLTTVVWAGFIYSVQVMWLSLIATTQSEFVSDAPYNFSIAVVGDTNFESLIDCLLGMFWGGQLSVKFVAWKVRRSNGILKPEFRLRFLLLPAVINSACLLLYDLGMNSGIHWIDPAGFGMIFLGFDMRSGGAIFITYAFDCYPQLQSESMVMMLFLRNMISMGFTFAIQPWLDTNGVVTTTWLMFMLSMFLTSLVYSLLNGVKRGEKLQRRIAPNVLTQNLLFNCF